MGLVIQPVKGLARNASHQFAGGVARTTGRVTPFVGAGYLGYNWLEDKVGGTAAKLLLGVSGIAIAYAAFRGIKSAISNTANMVWSATKLALIGGAAYLGISYLSGKFNKNAISAVAPNMSPSADPTDNILTRITRAFRAPAAAPETPGVITPQSDTGPVKGSPTKPVVPNPEQTPNLDGVTVRRTPVDVETESPKMSSSDATTRSPSVAAFTDASQPPKDITKPPSVPTADDLPAVDTTNPTRPVSNNLKAHVNGSVNEADTNARLASLVEAGDDATQIAKAEELGKMYALGKSSAELAGEIKNVMHAAKLRLAGNIPLVGMGIGAVAAGVTTYAFILQRQYAEALCEEGVITTDARDKYIEVSYLNQKILTGDIAISSIDPTCISLIGTLGAEGGTHHNFKEWMDKNAPLLEPEIARGLSASLFTPDTIHEQIANTLRMRIPASIDRVPETISNPEILRDVIKARNDLAQFGRENRAPHVPMMAPLEVTRQASEKRQIWEAEVAVHRNKFFDEVNKLVQNPEGMSAYLNLFSTNERLDIATRLSKSDENAPVTLRTYKQAQETWNPFDGRDAKRALTEDPQILNNYIKSRLQPSGSSSPKPQGGAYATRAPIAAGPV